MSGLMVGLTLWGIASCVGAAIWSAVTTDIKSSMYINPEDEEA